MCGIAGVVDRRQPEEGLGTLLEHMCETMRHRGPDDVGLSVDDGAGVAIGMRRLSIIDLAGGTQPFHSEDGQISAVANGEIYNFKPMREQLAAKGHTFRSQSDCEVVVHAYEEYGDAFLERIEGMFGLAIHDRRRGRVLIARDRFGIKPLYYREYAGTLWFGSEIKAILADKRVPRRLDIDALQLYLWNASVPDPLTLFNGIRKLPPAHSLVFDLSSRTCELRRYWRLTLGGDHGSETTTEAMEAALRDSVALHLQSDVPVGILLSGGVDSSAVTALAADLYPGDLHTFSVAFDIQGYSEFPYSQQVADRYGTTHHPVVMPAAHYWELVEKLIWNMDEPVCDPAMPAMFHICDAARNNVKVLLSGEGADELLGGYAGRLNGARDKNSPLGRLRHLALRSQAGGKPARLLDALRRFPTAARLPAPVWMLQTERLGWDDAGLNALLAPRSPTHPEAAWRQWLDGGLRDRWDGGTASLMDQLLYLDTNVNLPATLLMKADKMSMAASIELRVPFLGDAFTRYAASLPEGAKVDGDTGKALLKKAMEPYLSKDLLYRRKQGWPVPIGEWLRHDLRSTAEHWLLDENEGAAAILSPKTIRHAWTAHQSGQTSRGPQLWQLVLLALWRQRFDVTA